MLVHRQDNARDHKVQTQTIDRLVISSNCKNTCNGVTKCGQLHFPCLVGLAGIGQKLHEGDGITPIGCWNISYFLYRSDKISKPHSALSGFPIKKNDSWCDSTNSNHYNLPLAVTLPKSSETLWRPDNLYDIILVLDHNTQPAVRGRGSAIFMHLRGKNTKHTHGCIAYRKPDLLKILKQCGSNTKIFIKQ